MIHILGRSNTKTLAERVHEFEFHPQVYVYPAPRMYDPLPGFSLSEAAFTDEINLYVHIPFCRQICSFCGYLKTIDQEALRSDYVDTLVKETALHREALSGRVVRTLHFGGGTPSLLSPSDLEKVIAALLRINPGMLNTSQEVSIEATPESVEAAKFKEYRRLGINRVSLGVQSFEASEIELSKRANHPGASVKAMEELRETGIENIVIDLMIGIEGQSTGSFQDSVRVALRNRPETVQFYALGLQPQTLLGKSVPPNLMTGREIYRCYETGRDLFLKAGYAQDSFVRYVIPDKGSFLQEKYVFRGMSLIGFGAGARSYARNVHYRNAYDSSNGRRAITEYMRDVEEGKHSVKSGIFLNDDEVRRQYVIGNIESLDRGDFYERFGVRFEEEFSQVCRDMIESGLAEEEGPVLRLTPRGLLFRDLIARQFFSEEAGRREEVYRPTGDGAGRGKLPIDEY